MLASFKKYMAIAGAFIIAVLLAGIAGKREGRKAQQADDSAEAARNQREAIKERNDARNEVAKLPPGGAADELKRDWVRK